MAKKLHIDNWIDKAEPDFYTMFIKAWIPFNAWYFAEYGVKKDSAAIEQIKTTGNKIKNKLMSLLKNDDVESNAFKSHLAQLHVELEKRSVKNYGKDVSFCSIAVTNYAASPSTDTDKNGNVYKAIPSKTTGYRAIIVDKSGKSIMDKTFNPYDINAFLLENQFIKLPNKQIKAKIKKCFENIAPNQTINLVTTSTNKGDYLWIDKSIKLKYVNDESIISDAIIDILYTLRCLLFHGELDPTQINMAIYEHAYQILKTIIKELK